MSFFSASEIETLSQTVVRSDLLAELQFVSGTKRVWNGNTDLIAGGETWLPMHGHGQISDVSFSREPVSERFTVSLDGIPSSEVDILTTALAETNEAEGQLIKIYIQLFDEDWQPVGSPLGLKWGFMRKPRVSRSRMDGVDGGVQRISIGCENVFYNRSLPPAGRYTDRDQQARYSGDLICQFQPDLLNKTFTYPDY